MSKIVVTPSEKNRLYIHPDTKQEFPSGKAVETEKDWFVSAKLNMGHLKTVEHAGHPEEAPAESPTSEEPLSLEAFEKLNAADQKKELLRLELAADDKDDALLNKESRVALYAAHLNGADA
ncbi:hypothetical protein [Brevibacillus reuszeri]|uniref:hypothetical protein n=1 Tax=Brevibacillus reuszeri TaxID=54915 RepID=UPI000CCC77B1|nr:hypothetical protein [Brevibacillus reuszeri]